MHKLQSEIDADQFVQLRGHDSAQALRREHLAVPSVLEDVHEQFAMIGIGNLEQVVAVGLEASALFGVPVLDGATQRARSGVNDPPRFLSSDCLIFLNRSVRSIPAVGGCNAMIMAQPEKPGKADMCRGALFGLLLSHGSATPPADNNRECP